MQPEMQTPNTPFIECWNERTARLLGERGEPATAQEMAHEALEIAKLLERPTEVVLALVAIARCARVSGDEAGCSRATEALERVEAQKASSHARSVLSQWRAER